MKDGIAGANFIVLFKTIATACSVAGVTLYYAKHEEHCSDLAIGLLIQVISGDYN
jgi:hypothetical protein